MIALPQAPRRAVATAVAALFALAIAGTPAAAQVLVDSFPAGFTPALGWQGDRAAFAGEGGRLVLREGRPTPAPTARVWFAAETRDSACWSVDVEQRFSASASNRVRWWLAADRALDQAGVQGVYLQLGGISGDADAIDLVEVTAAGTSVIAGGRPGVAAADPLALQLRVCADSGNDWTWAARSRDGALVDSAAGSSAEPLRGRFVGFDIAFTPTRSGLLSFDDLTVGPIFRDTEAPALVLATAASPTLVLVVADEPLGTANLDPGRYAVDGRAPASVEVAGDTLRLRLTAPLVEGRPTALELLGLVDAAGNVGPPVSTTVTSTAPRQLARYDLLISEIMADPSPVVGLPDVEYVEVYNPGSAAVDLSVVRLDNGRTSVALPARSLAAGAYLAFASEAVADPRYAVVPQLPTLTNSGATLRLIAADGTLVDEVTYDDAYYRPGTADGGYALERADLARPCLLGADNLRSSEALAGGTPSAPNSMASGPAPVPLRISTVTRLGDTALAVTTNRTLDDPRVAFTLDGGRSLGSVRAGATFGTYVLTLDRPLAASELLQLGLSPQARSCVPGESLAGDAFAIGIPEPSLVGDWALNEIMYDPLSGQGRWVELANVSDKLLSLAGLTLARASRDRQVEARFGPAREALVPAGELLVLAAAPETLLAQFPEARPGLVVEASVPTLSDEACLMLFDAATEEIHFHICYTEAWHNAAYAKTDGVSLERIDLNADGQDPSNWTSAASTVGFGTPTRANSQALPPDAGAGAATQFALVAERISPDGDGFEDLLTVRFDLEASETLARFSVVDLRGYTVYQPAEDVSVGRRGTWTWDGVDRDGEVAAVGTYVLRVEYWSPSSPARREYLPFSLVARR